MTAVEHHAAGGAAPRRPESDGGAIPEWSDRVNPLLLKEMRQAFKSRSFVWTFFALLAGIWLWTMLVVAFSYPSIRYAPHGVPLIAGYAWLMIPALIVVIPFATFRSMEGERRHATYELLSITSLGADQIVRGKLVTMMAMALVFYSLIAPCLVFAYMLGGVDLVQTLSIPAFLLFVSLVATTAALFLGTIAKNDAVSTILTLSLCIALFFLASLVGIVVTEILDGQPIVFGERQGLIASIGAAACVGLAMIELVVAAAAANLMPPEVDRASFIRYRLLAVQATWIVLSSVLIHSSHNDAEVVFGTISAATIFWLVVGIFMIGERGELTPRVRRELSDRVWLRVVASWRMPGNAAAYLFAVATMTSLSLVIAVISLAWLRAGVARRLTAPQVVCLLTVNAAYFTAYLGVIRLAVLTCKKWRPRAGFVSALVIGASILFVGNAVPTLIAVTFAPAGTVGYSMLALTVWPWTISTVSLDIAATRTGVPPYVTVLVRFVVAVALCVFLLNLRSIVRQLFVPTAAIPEAVADEKRGPERDPTPTDPFGDD